MIDTMSEKDNNLDRIIDQQAYIKQIIEKDGRISYLKKSISDNNNAIEAIRKHCSKISFDNQNEKQDLIKVQATEVSSRDNELHLDQFHKTNPCSKILYPLLYDPDRTFPNATVKINQ